MDTPHISGRYSALHLNLLLGLALLSSTAQATVETSLSLLPPTLEQSLQQPAKQTTQQLSPLAEQKEGKALSQSEIIDQATSQSADAHVITKNKDGSIHIPSPMQDVIATLTPKGASIYSDDEAGESFALLVNGLGREKTKLTQIKPGKVTYDEKIARLFHHNLIEEFSTSSAGIRQDFVVPVAPKGKGKLVVELDIEGAIASLSDKGAMLTLKSGRELAYHNLMVADAAGKTLPAHFAVKDKQTLHIVVDDKGAVYPVRIDPTITDVDWFSLGVAMPSPTGTIYALASDGSGNLYLGGNFIQIIGIANTANIAKWDGSNWSALGTGVNSTVRALTLAGTMLYAGGHFTSAGGVSASYIARWNGSSWSAVGGGTNDWVLTLATDGNSLYAGGNFTTAGGVHASFIARWSGISWNPVGGGMSAPVYALLLVGTDLYAGGNFASASGVTVNRIAKWNGISWSALGSGVNVFVSAQFTYVHSLAWDGSNLYAGGFFTHAGGELAKNIAKWDGSAWSALGTGINSKVYALAWDGASLYAGGEFNNAGGVTALSIAKWDGIAWSALSSNMNDGPVQALIFDGTNLYAGGSFTSIGGTLTDIAGSSIRSGGISASRIARWDGSVWHKLGSGLNSTIKALASDDSNLYVGGLFTNAGDVSADHIAKWDGNTWSTLGSGISGYVYALVSDGINLYAGGHFTNVGGVNANYIAKWDGNAWSALGSGMNGYVYALAWDGTNLYAGGNFSTADGIAVTGIAKWDGSVWNSLGSDLTNGTVKSLLWTGSDLYAGGGFNLIDGSSGYIAKWNGSTWNALSTGPRDAKALTWDGANLYAGGVYGIEKWDGSNWSTIGSGMVNALAWDGANLYAGGQFNNSFGTVNYIKKWNGFTWSTLAADISGFPISSNNIYALLWNGASLYAGGLFTTAGDKKAGYVAGININLTKPDPLVFTDLADVEIDTLTISNMAHIAGFIGSVDLTITGGEYSLNGGDFTSTLGTATNGDAIQLRTTSSVNYEMTTDVIINAGASLSTWNVTTLVDTVPDAFSFTDQNAVSPSTLITSNAITITGLGASTTISIIGGEYNINGASFTSYSSFVNNNDIVTIRTHSSANWLTTTHATLTIGGISGTITVSTDADTDNDGVGDTTDAFPNNVAASKDIDSDGKPDEWNAICDSTCQTNSGLTLDGTGASSGGGSFNPLLLTLAPLFIAVTRRKKRL